MADNIVTVVVRIGEDKKKYTLETIVDGSSVARQDMVYYDYFTEGGVFLSFKFRKVLEAVVENTEKVLK